VYVVSERESSGQDDAGLFAVATWVAVSGLFALYVSSFSSHNKTYGALAGIIIFLVWLWISNVAIPLGAR
jgi:membrane protein